MCITLHLSVGLLNLSCQLFDQEHNESRSCRSVALSAGVFIKHEIFVSSANNLNSFLIQFGSSFTKRRKRSGDASLRHSAQNFLKL